MIINYKNFTINEDWQSDLKDRIKSICNPIISKEEIEDVFLELIDMGFSFSSTMQPGYMANYSFQGVGRKIDLVNHSCYPFFRITLRKETDLGNSLSQSKEKLRLYDGYINSIKVALKRINSDKKDVEIINSKVSLQNSNIIFDILLKINSRLGSINNPEKPMLSSFEKVRNTLSRNPLFKILKVGIDCIYISPTKDRADIGQILSNILRRFEVNNSLTIKTYELKDNTYKIVILEK